MVGILVFEAGLPLEEVNEMEMHDAQRLLPEVYRRTKTVAEGLRLNAYITARVNSRQLPSIHKFYPFPWEVADELRRIAPHVQEIKKRRDELNAVMNAIAETL